MLIGCRAVGTPPLLAARPSLKIFGWMELICWLSPLRFSGDYPGGHFIMIY